MIPAESPMHFHYRGVWLRFGTSCCLNLIMWDNDRIKDKHREMNMSKAARAVEIYQEEQNLGADNLRKRCIARFKSELAMGDAGAGTYFQNTKKKLEGTDGNTPQLQLSVKAAPKSTPAPTVPVIDQLSWIRYEEDDKGIVSVVECYATQEDQLEAQAEKGGKVTLGMDVINVGDSYK